MAVEVIVHSPLYQETLERNSPEFLKARARAHSLARRDLVFRIRSNRVPSQEEVQLGAFVEELEPQVRDAVREFNRKGYPTRSSGFYLIDGSQTLDGPFKVSPEVEAKLKTLGVTTEKQRDGSTSLKFWPQEQNLETIAAHWRLVAEAMPDLGSRAKPVISGGSLSFWEKYAPEVAVRYREGRYDWDSQLGEATLPKS